MRQKRAATVPKGWTRSGCLTDGLVPLLLLGLIFRQLVSAHRTRTASVMGRDRGGTRCQPEWKGVPRLFLGVSSAEERLVRRVVARLRKPQTVHEEAE